MRTTPIYTPRSWISDVCCSEALIQQPTHIQSSHNPALHCCGRFISITTLALSVYLAEYALTMVMGMNDCGAVSLTSSGLINGTSQNTLKLPVRLQSFGQEGTLQSVGVQGHEKGGCVWLCTRYKDIIALSVCVWPAICLLSSQKQRSRIHNCLPAVFKKLKLLGIFSQNT